MFTLGFQISYLTFGYFLSQILTSSIQFGFKIGLGECKHVLLTSLQTDVGFLYSGSLFVVVSVLAGRAHSPRSPRLLTVCLQ